MPFVPAPNIIQIEMRAVRNGAQVENRIMYDMLAPVTPTNLQDVAIAAWNWWENDYADFLSASVNLKEVVCTDLTVHEGAQYTYAPDTTTVGGIVGLALPNEAAFCVSLRTGHRGRSARGRFYTLSVVFDQMADDNFLEPTAAENFRASVGRLMVNLTAEGGLPVIVSYITNNAPRPGGPVYFPITNVTVVDNEIDSMKSRKPGVGM